MNVYDITLASRVTGTFRVIAGDLEEAWRKAKVMYVNGIDHGIGSIEMVENRKVEEKQ